LILVRAVKTALMPVSSMYFAGMTKIRNLSLRIQKIVSGAWHVKQPAQLMR